LAATEAADIVLVPFWADVDSYEGVTRTALLVRRLGKTAYMFSFEGKDHNLLDTPADREQLKYWAVHFDEWFDYWLEGAPRPAWFDGAIERVLSGAGALTTARNARELDQRVAELVGAVVPAVGQHRPDHQGHRPGVVPVQRPLLPLLAYLRRV